VTALFRVEPLGKQHNRKDFSCGVAPLDDYLRTKVSEDLKRLVATCFVAVEQSTAVLAGYYTLSATSILLTDLPEATAKRLPRYPTVPAVRLGRLAVSLDFRGEGLGGALLMDASRRVLRSDVGAFAMVVDAKDETGVQFYLHHGFIRFLPGMTLFLPLDTLRAGFEKRR